MLLQDPWASQTTPEGYWGPAISENKWAQAITTQTMVNRDISQALLGKANNAFHARPVELVQTAILYSFVQVFADSQATTIFTEGHGQEPWDAHIDITCTVGWFTTIAPLFVDVNKQDDIVRVLERTKDSRRQHLSHGFASFSHRYLHEQDLKDPQPMEILFNYLGLFEQLDRPGALFHFPRIANEAAMLTPGGLPRFAVIDVNPAIIDGHMNLNFIHNSRTEKQDRILRWVETCRETLASLPDILQQEQRLTMSDLPPLSFTDDNQL